MASVTIEGSIKPSVFLARGERRTVQRTKRVENLIRQGYVVEVADGQAQPMPEPAADDRTPHTENEPPARNASREDWAEFLAVHSDIVTEGKGRDDLIAEWDASNPQA